MPLTQCPECKKDVSSQATTCPHCGYPLTASQDKSAPSGPATPPPIQPQGQMPPISFGTSSSPKKKMSKAKLGCLVILAIIAIFVLLAIIGAFMSGSPQDNIPSTTKIIPDQICFRQWKDVEDFNTQLSQAIDRLTAGKKLLEMSDAESAEIGKKSQDEIQVLKAQFAAEGRLWDVPVGTEVKISKFYDGKGNEITPEWKPFGSEQKALYTPDGNSVYVAAEWNGKVIYTMFMEISPK
jgi:ABC-type maltose transport system permease subunit